MGKLQLASAFSHGAPLEHLERKALGHLVMAPHVDQVPSHHTRPWLRPETLPASAWVDVEQPLRGRHKRFLPCGALLLWIV